VVALLKGEGVIRGRGRKAPEKLGRSCYYPSTELPVTEQDQTKKESRGKGQGGARRVCERSGLVKKRMRGQNFLREKESAECLGCWGGRAKKSLSKKKGLWKPPQGGNGRGVGSKRSREKKQKRKEVKISLLEATIPKDHPR